MKKKNNKYILQFKQRITKKIEKVLSIIRVMINVIYYWIEGLRQHNKAISKLDGSNDIENIVSENEKLKKIIGEKELEIYILKNYLKKRRN